MKLDKFSHLLVCVMAIACPSHALDETLDPETAPHHTRSLLFFNIFPPHKPVSIFSKPRPENDDELPPERKPEGLVSHLGNVLHGGSISIQIRPLAPFQGILDHAKKILPGHGIVGRPSHERPGHPDNYERPHQQRPGYQRPGHEGPHKQRPGYENPHEPKPGHAHEQEPDYEKPHQPEPGYEKPHQQRPGYQRPHQQRPGYQRPHQERPGYERPHQERPGFGRPHPQRPGYERPHQQRPGYEQPEVPKKPQEIPKKEDSEELNENLPAWEDIGEEDYGDGVLQPRGKRPKRFVESKIYYVPLLYKANGRTHLVRRVKGGKRTTNGIKEV